MLDILSGIKTAHRPSDLPIHSTTRTTFQERRHTHIIAKTWKTFKRALIELPSEPSDPLKDSEDGATASDVASSYQAKEKRAAEDEDEDWYVNQTIVTSDDYMPDGNEENDNEKDLSHTRDSFLWGSSYEDLRTTQWRQPQMLPRLMFRAIKRFFDLSFAEEDKEMDYQKESWYAMKSPAKLAAGFLILNWALFIGLFRTIHIYQEILYYGGLTFFTWTSFFMVIFDLPISKSPSMQVLFQVWFALATWYCGVTILVDAKVCGFFANDKYNFCEGKDFPGMMFYITGLPCVSLFTISKRLYNAIAQVIVFILLLVLVTPEDSKYIRVLVLYVAFAIFMQWLHYNKEKSKRRVFKLQYRIRHLYRELDKAQHSLKKEAKAREQFSAYIFHEVRVPLNTATLALQNLHLKGCFDSADADTTIDIHALEGSLKITGQILNDVLDLQRMVSQQFAIESRAFPLHRTLDSALRFMDVETSRKDLHLVIDLDPKVDEVVEYPPDRRHGGLWVYGDDLRLRQLIGNLLSNAVKFTPEKGSIRVSTKLLWPPADGSEPEDTSLIRRAKASTEKMIVWRLEVQDSGPGIKPSDLWGTSLFQPFVQTSVGKNSGTGSGLGLAIIKSIITLSGGRLGIRSHRNGGATFWVELLYPLLAPDKIADSFSIKFPPPRDPSTSILEVPSASMTPIVDSPEERSEVPPILGHPRAIHWDSKIDGKRDSIDLSTPDVQSVIDDDAPLRVLVVDDDELTRKIMGRNLTKRYSCTLETASDGQEAIDKIVGPRPDGKDIATYDIIFMDNRMPHMSGEACVLKLRNLGLSDLYIVGATGNALREDIKNYLQAGVDEVLTKPLMDVSEVMNTAREKRKQRQRIMPPIHRTDHAIL